MRCMYIVSTDQNCYLNTYAIKMSGFIHIEVQEKNIGFMNTTER